MDVTIHTSDFEAVNPEDVATALIQAGWYVATVQVIEREPERRVAVWEDTGRVTTR